jgi:hypothetical protein
MKVTEITEMPIYGYMALGWQKGLQKLAIIKKLNDFFLLHLHVQCHPGNNSLL